MITKRKFYKRVIEVVVLSEESLDCDSLADIQYAITEGDCSGSVTTTSDKEINGLEMAQELIAQASDPGFFELNEDGSDKE